MGRAKRYIITIADDNRGPLDSYARNSLPPAPPATCYATHWELMSAHRRPTIASATRPTAVALTARDEPRLAEHDQSVAIVTALYGLPRLSTVVDSMDLVISRSQISCARSASFTTALRRFLSSGV